MAPTTYLLHKHAHINTSIHTHANTYTGTRTSSSELPSTSSHRSPPSPSAASADSASCSTAIESMARDFSILLARLVAGLARASRATAAVLRVRAGGADLQACRAVGRLAGRHVREAGRAGQCQNVHGPGWGL